MPWWLSFVSLFYARFCIFVSVHDAFKTLGRPLRALERRGDRQDTKRESPETEGAPGGRTKARPRRCRSRGNGSRRGAEAADSDAHAGAAVPASAGGGCRGGRLCGWGGPCSVSGLRLSDGLCVEWTKRKENWKEERRCVEITSKSKVKMNK